MERHTLHICICPYKYIQGKETTNAAFDAMSEMCCDVLCLEWALWLNSLAGWLGCLSGFGSQLLEAPPPPLSQVIGNNRRASKPASLPTYLHTYIPSYLPIDSQSLPTYSLAPTLHAHPKLIFVVAVFRNTRDGFDVCECAPFRWYHGIPAPKHAEYLNSDDAWVLAQLSLQICALFCPSPEAIS